MTDIKIKWHTEVRQVSDLVKWDRNPRRVTEQELDRLKKKIIEQGFHDVLVIDTDNTILSGNQRKSILEGLGVTEVTCMVPERKLTDEERDKVALSANLHEGTWDFDLLANSFEVPLLLDQGFTKLQLGMNSLFEDEFDVDKEVEAITTPVTQYGDIYQLGRHRIGCLDSTKIDDVRNLMGGGVARLVFTDPPYMVDYHAVAGGTFNSDKYENSGTILNDKMSDDDAKIFFVKILNNLYQVTTDDACIYWWFANKNNWINRLSFMDSGWKMSQIIIWIKNAMVFSAGQDYHRQYEPCMFGWKDGKAHFRNKKYNNFKDVFNLDIQSFEEMFDIWYQKRDSFKDYIHPTQKPVRLAERALRKHSEVDDIVVDLFSGSASTLIACEQAQRSCRTMDLDPKFVDAGIKRFVRFNPGAEVKCLTREVDMSQFK